MRSALEDVPDDAQRFEGTVASHWVDREARDDVDDAFGGSLWIAWGPWSSFVTPQLEAGVGYSQHRVAGFRSDKLEVYRVGAGLKLTVGGDERVPLALWARAGLFHRWSIDAEFDDAVFERQGDGRYFGAGVEWTRLDGFRVGPYFETYRDDHGGFEERLYGLSISFSR